jgi:hypothetical protein
MNFATEKIKRTRIVIAKRLKYWSNRSSIDVLVARLKPATMN